ncbi:MAG: hypothetical protein Q8M65_03585, partial [Rhodoglobus sp.]|nr:hypothetical protein [Rhodoglobus sp.]
MSAVFSFRTDRWVYLSIGALALVSWGFILFTPNALFWDDWVLAGDDTLRMTSELGLPWVGYIDIALFALGPWAFKVVVVLSTIVIGCASYSIASSGLGLSRLERGLLAALVVTLPLMAAKALVSLSLYSWSLALFMVAWYLLVRQSPQQAGRTRHVVATVLLLVSYTTGSLLPFTVLPVVHLALLGYSRESPPTRQAIRFIGRYWYVFAAPVVFWFVRTLFLQPYGLYDKYNSVGELTQAPAYFTTALVALVFAFVVVLAVLVYSALARRPISARLRHALVMIALSGATGILGLYFYFTRVSVAPGSRLVPVVILLTAVTIAVVSLVDVARSRATVPRTLNVTPVLAVGLLVLILGVLPYLLVGKLPS